METVSDFRPVTLILNKNMECGVICNMINKAMESYFKNNPNDGNNVLKITINRIIDSPTESGPLRIECNNSNLPT